MVQARRHSRFIHVLIKLVITQSGRRMVIFG
jgi:hypothetical protein